MQRSFFVYLVCCAVPQHFRFVFKLPNINCYFNVIHYVFCNPSFFAYLKISPYFQELQRRGCRVDHVVLIRGVYQLPTKHLIIHAPLQRSTPCVDHTFLVFVRILIFPHFFLVHNREIALGWPAWTPLCSTPAASRPRSDRRSVRASLRAQQRFNHPNFWTQFRF